MQPPQRPSVSVIVPFYGSAEEGLAAIDRLARVALGVADEMIVVDNTPGQDLRRVAPVRHGWSFVDAGARASPYTARNAGAAAARTDWLLFTDADCIPEPALVDAYFAEPPPAAWGAIAGEILGVADQPGTIPEYIRSRRHLEAAVSLAHPYKPFVVTANVLVRREAFEAVGGFCEGVRSGADTDFCWRVQEAGWQLGHRPEAIVRHVHRESLRALLRQTMRDHAGAAWLNRRYPGSMRLPGAVALVRCAVGAVVWTVALQPRRALFKAIDALIILSGRVGALASNVGADGHGLPAVAGDVAARDVFPAVSGAQPSAQRVEAQRRPMTAGASRLPAAFAEDDGPMTRAAALVWLAVRAPHRIVAGLARHRSAALSWAPAARRLVERDERLTDTEPDIAAVLATLAGRRSER